MILQEKTGDFGPSEGVIYKKADQKEIDLEEGEMVCTMCNGWGKVYHKHDDGIFQCSRCRGRGKLDWVENIVGVRGSSGIFGTRGFHHGT